MRYLGTRLQLAFACLFALSATLSTAASGAQTAHQHIYVPSAKTDPNKPVPIDNQKPLPTKQPSDPAQSKPTPTPTQIGNIPKTPKTQPSGSSGPGFWNNVVAGLGNVLSQQPKQPKQQPDPVLNVCCNLSAKTGQAISVSAAWSPSVFEPSYLFTWGDEGDSAPSSDAQESHVYTRAGTFQVLVQSRGTFEDRTVAKRQTVAITVQAAPPPQEPSATLTLYSSVHSALPGRAVRFTVAITPAATAASYRYNFGDGEQETGPNGITHSYATPGTYSICASTTPEGQAEVTSPPFQLTIVPAALPSLTLKPSTLQPLAGDHVGVTASLTPGDGKATYTFDWGDGSKPTSAGALGDASHIYQTSGEHSVTVTAHLPPGAAEPTVTASINLSVNPPPPPPRPIPPIVPLSAVLGAAALGGYFFFKPRVSAVYRSTTFDSPTISVTEAPPLSVSFRPRERPAQHRIRILK